MEKPVDSRGYAGAERNRQLDPEQVVWARRAAFNREVTPRQLADMWNMSPESVRRMLRGETYSNVGMAMPRAQEASRRMTPTEEDAAASAARVAQALGLTATATAPARKEEGLAEGEEPNMLELFGATPPPPAQRAAQAGEGEDRAASKDAAIDAFLGKT